MAYIGDREKLEYKKQYKRLVARTADNLSAKHCEKLCFFYTGEVIPRSYSEKHGDNPLKLLGMMQDKNAFSHDKPEKLAELMEEIGSIEMQRVVENFISENRAVISALSFQHRALPPRPIPCTSGTFPSSPPTPSPPQFTDPCLRPSDNPPLATPPGMEEEADPYTRFYPASHFSGISNDTESDEHPKSTTSSSNEEDVYCVPYDWIVQTTPQRHFPIHKERMKLLIRPIQDIITQGMERRITTQIECRVPKAKFDLIITSGHSINDRYLSAKLYIYPGSQLEREVKDGSYYFQAELQMRQKLKKQKQHQNIYSHSTLLDLPLVPATPKQSNVSLHYQPDSLETLRSEESLSQATPLGQPDSLQTNISAPIQETLHPSQQQTEGNLQLLSDERRRTLQSPLLQQNGEGPELVASFPAIISHRNFLNSKLISGPYLKLVFTLTQY